MVYGSGNIGLPEYELGSYMKPGVVGSGLEETLLERPISRTEGTPTRKP